MVAQEQHSRWHLDAVKAIDGGGKGTGYGNGQRL